MAWRLKVVSDHCGKMRRKKETNLTGDPMSKTRTCTNDSENVTRSQESGATAVGDGEEDAVSDEG